MQNLKGRKMLVEPGRGGVCGQKQTLNSNSAEFFNVWLIVIGCNGGPYGEDGGGCGDDVGGRVAADDHHHHFVGGDVDDVNDDGDGDGGQFLERDVSDRNPSLGRERFSDSSCRSTIVPSNTRQLYQAYVITVITLQCLHYNCAKWYWKIAPYLPIEQLNQTIEANVTK